MRNRLRYFLAGATIFAVSSFGCQRDALHFEPFHLGMIDEDLAAIDIEGSGPDCDSIDSFDPFCALFCERKNEAVERFVRERSRHFFTMEQAARLRFEPSERTLLYTDFLNERPPPRRPSGQGGGPLMLAANMSFTPYAIGAVNQEVVRVRGPGVDIVGDSTRSGIIIVPEDYRAEKLSREKKQEMSRAEAEGLDRWRRLLRQEILVHEARHSDCTGGFDESAIRMAKLAIDRQDFAERSRTQCGNPHFICTRGDYRGYDACESQPWGSYAVQLVFLMEARKKLPPQSIEAVMVNASIVDLRSRFEEGILDVDAMLSGKLGKPGPHHDSSSDLRSH